MKNTLYKSTAFSSVFTVIFSKKALFLGLFSISLFAFSLVAIDPQVAYAATPTVSISSAGSNTVQLSVQGDQNQSVNLFYYPLNSSGSINSVGSIGFTNSSGYFSNTVSSSAYNIPAGSNVYVVVNGQQSSTIQWPSIAGGNVFLSQSSITMNQGQTSSVSISGGLGTNTSNAYYVASNSNSTVVGTSISGSILTISATNPGYAVINVCSLSSNSGCSSVAVTVNNTWGGNNGNNFNQIVLSQSSVTVAPGQTQTVTIYENGYNSGFYTNNNGYSNRYYIANNPGSSIFSASLSGNTIIIYGSNAGSATVNICSQNSTSSCVSLYVTVSGTYYNNTYNNGNWYNNGYNGFTTSDQYSYTYPASYTYPTNTYVTNSNIGRPVSGVFLSQLPATGINFSLKMTLFILGLLFWSLFIAFMIARKREAQLVGFGVPLVSEKPKTMSEKMNAFKVENMKKKVIL